MAADKRIEDRKTGIAIRFIDTFDPAQLPLLPVDVVILSCQWLGHTFDNNRDPNEQRCGVCGIYRTIVSG